MPGSAVYRIKLTGIFFLLNRDNPDSIIQRVGTALSERSEDDI
jgi:hypothetical protein